MKPGKWTRVSKAAPCGICRKPDWCGRGEKGWCCMRVESARLFKNGGWYHPFDPTWHSRPFAHDGANSRSHGTTPAPRSRALGASRPGADTVPSATCFSSAKSSESRIYDPLRDPERLPEPRESAPPDFSALMQDWRNATGADLLSKIAHDLGVSERSLTWLGVAWASAYGAVAFPMFDATSSTIDHPCGIRLRKPNGKKFAVTGSKAGIFIPYGALTCLRADRIFICEGPTDTAACLDLGLFALGRASCRGGVDYILSALSQLHPSETVVVSDNDGPGIAGADHLMKLIRGRKVKLTPPCKDMRTFVHNGGTAEVIGAMLKDLVRG